jgi:2-iminobutanoate/2-iminopropanoate deaminase
MERHDRTIVACIIVCVFLAGFAAAAIAGVLLLQPEHTVIATDLAPKPVGPYSQAVQYGDIVFLSGQIGLDPVTMNLNGTTGGQTVRAMENQKAVLAAAGLTFSDVVSTRIYLTNMSDWDAVNRIYGSYFTEKYPARATVQAAGLPKGAAVEIEMVAKRR